MNPARLLAARAALQSAYALAPRSVVSAAPMAPLRLAVPLPAAAVAARPAAASAAHALVATRGFAGKVRNKTKSAVKKRFRFTGTGKLVRGKAGRGHMLVNKSRNRVNRLGKDAIVEGGDRKHVIKLLGKSPLLRTKARYVD